MELSQRLFVLPEGDPTRTFANDELLPPLPVPSLRHTLDRYLDSVKPFLNENELRETTKCVAEFERGVGQRLHAKLLQRAQRERNWLEKWWEEMAYLRNRQPLLPFTSTIGIGGKDYLNWETGNEFNAIKNAALFCYFTTEVWSLFRQGRWRPDSSRDGNSALNMYDFRRLFNTVRIPGETQDSLVSYFKTESEGPCPSHVIVLCNGHIFSVDALDTTGSPLSPPEWEQKLTDIFEKSSREKGPGLPLFTCTDRTTWAKNRKHLESLSVNNKSALHTVDTAMFVMVLSKDVKLNVSDVAQASLDSDMENRWADKSLMCVIYRNGLQGGVNEHTAYDGMVSVMAMNYISLRLNEIGFRWHDSETVRNLPPVQQIRFDIDRQVEESLQEASRTLQPYRSCWLWDKFTGYGKDLIKTFDLHPDSFVQMALQLAYFRLHHRPAPTYETGTTRSFYHGRTETVRSCTPEAIAWVHSMLSPSTPNSTKRELLKKAVAKHNLLMKEAKAGEGCDRHLLGLYCTAMAEGCEIPAIFTDPAFTKSGGGGNFILSTSLLGYTPLSGGSLPMCREGYGCFYNFYPKRINFTITAFRDSSETSTYRFFQSIQQSLEDMKNIFTGLTSNL
ncbi:peroxisomal carnitine O-octanoyltransferase [Periplaneta americana]|uniref:peroxisomal carnitine O-octanoyltransferase n=1 Tax=Periplaneta americana TaxID=6978 RepID=UPI0037E95713